LTGAASRDANRTSAARRKRKCRKMRRGRDRPPGKVGRRRRNPPGRLTVVLNRIRQSDTGARIYPSREIRPSPPVTSKNSTTPRRRTNLISRYNAPRIFLSDRRGGGGEGEFHSFIGALILPLNQTGYHVYARVSYCRTEAGNGQTRLATRENLGHLRFDLISCVFSFVGNFAETFCIIHTQNRFCLGFMHTTMRNALYSFLYCDII